MTASNVEPTPQDGDCERAEFSAVLKREISRTLDAMGIEHHWKAQETSASGPGIGLLCGLVAKKKSVSLLRSPLASEGGRHVLNYLHGEVLTDGQLDFELRCWIARWAGDLRQTLEHERKLSEAGFQPDAPPLWLLEAHPLLPLLFRRLGRTLEDVISAADWQISAGGWAAETAMPAGPCVLTRWRQQIWISRLEIPPVDGGRLGLMRFEEDHSRPLQSARFQVIVERPFPESVLAAIGGADLASIIGLAGLASPSGISIASAAQSSTGAGREVLVDFRIDAKPVAVAHRPAKALDFA